MKVLVQRVRRGSVSVDERVVGEIGKGYVVLVGVRHGDTPADAQCLAQKTVGLRVFPDEQDRMNLSIQDVGGQILVISQFTLYADTRKGNRPSFIEAAPAGQARDLYENYIDCLRSAIGESRVATGVFGAMMFVEIGNEGPVTVELSTDR